MISVVEILPIIQQHLFVEDISEAKNNNINSLKVLHSREFGPIVSPILRRGTASVYIQLVIMVEVNVAMYFV